MAGSAERDASYARIEIALARRSAIMDHVYSGATPDAGPRCRRVRLAVARLRLAHVELRSVPTYEQLLAVFQREEISIHVSRFGTLLGRAATFAGMKMIFLDSRLEGEELIEVALHELGHMKLHVFDKRLRDGMDDELERWPRVFRLFDRTELEAYLFRDILLLRA